MVCFPLNAANAVNPVSAISSLGYLHRRPLDTYRSLMFERIMKYEIGPQETVPEAVVYCVSALENQPPVSLPPLYRTVDTDALTAIWSDTDETLQNEVRVSFQYSDSQVTVENGEVITVTTT